MDAEINGFTVPYHDHDRQVAVKKRSFDSNHKQTTQNTQLPAQGTQSSKELKITGNTASSKEPS